MSVISSSAPPPVAPVAAAPASLCGKLSLFARDIKISHTVFAMPWAVLSAVMAWRRVGGPVAGKLGIVLVCMVTARTVAMAANRLLDAELDRRNPRTARRAIPRGAARPPLRPGGLGPGGAAFFPGPGGFWGGF